MGQKDRQRDAVFSWSEHVERLDETAFKLRYRLTLRVRVPSIYELLDLVGDQIDITDEVKAFNSKGMHV